MTRTRSLIRVALIAIAAAALLGGVGLAAPAAAQGVIGPGSGRAGATVAAGGGADRHGHRWAGSGPLTAPADRLTG